MTDPTPEDWARDLWLRVEGSDPGTWRDTIAAAIREAEARGARAQITNPIAAKALALADVYLKNQDAMNAALAKMGISDARAYMLAAFGPNALTAELWDAADAYRAAKDGAGAGHV